MSEYIYLLQEREFITTKQNIYKLGKTKQENLQRFKQYPKGSKLILQQVCYDCDMLETQLIREFKNKYIHRRDIGNEYFEGDYNEMVKDIHNKITNNDMSNEDTDEDEDKPQIEIDDEVKELFPNYCEDEAFGGKKKLIKIFIEVHQISIKYIDCEIYDWEHNYMVNEVEAYRDEWDNNCKYEDMKYKDSYYDKIIKHKVIENNKIYDLNDSKFVKQLDKYKHYVQLHYSDKLVFITDKYRLHFKDKHSLIQFYIQNNAILNDVIYCGLIKDICYIDFFSDDALVHHLDSNTHVKLRINIKTINGFGFDYDYLKKYSPYCIDINDNGEYYMLNRDYKIITTEEGSIKDFTTKERIYLHRGNETPWAYNTEEEIKMLYQKVLSKLNKTTINKICKNENQHTSIILTKCV